MLVLALLAMGAPALTAGPEDGIRPEFLAGTLGGYAGAALGTYTLSWAFSLPVFPGRSRGDRGRLWDRDCVGQPGNGPPLRSPDRCRRGDGRVQRRRPLPKVGPTDEYAPTRNRRTMSSRRGAALGLPTRRRGAMRTQLETRRRTPPPFRSGEGFSRRGNPHPRGVSRDVPAPGADRRRDHGNRSARALRSLNRRGQQPSGHPCLSQQATATS